MIEIASLLIGVVSAGLSVYFYMKSKRTDEVSRGFYKSISQQANSISRELDRACCRARDTNNFDSLIAETSSILSHVGSLKNTIENFEEVMWGGKVEK